MECRFLAGRKGPGGAGPRSEAVGVVRELRSSNLNGLSMQVMYDVLCCSSESVFSTSIAFNITLVG